MMKNTLSQSEYDNMKIPVGKLSFAEIIKGLSGHNVLLLDEENDKELLNKLHKAAQLVVDNLKNKPIISSLVSKVGNDIEIYVKEALQQVGLTVETPRGKSGKSKASGYPDFLIGEANGKPTYLECKTFSGSNINTTFRSFYLSPSDDFKVNLDARHLLIAFEMVANGNSYTAKGYKLLSLENLLLDVKYEFNASNRALYKETKILKSRQFI